MTTTSLAIAVFATWRLTHLLWGEDGPWNVVASLRRVASDRFWGRLLDCFYCVSLWIAAPIAWALEPRWIQGALLWLALSGGAIVLERLTAGAAPAAPARWHVDPVPDRGTEETNDVMLR